MNIELNIVNKINHEIPAKREIKQVVLTILEDNKITYDVVIGIEIVGQSEILKLNKKYRQINKPTDVLSFPIYNHPPKKSDQPILLGDIIICPKCAQKDFLFLIRHSVLHLLGYHHK